MELYSYGEDTQKFFIDFLLSCEESFSRCQNIINPEYFEDEFKPTIRYIQEYVNEYNCIPKLEQIKSQTGLQFEIVNNIREQDKSWFLDNIEQFCRHKAIELAVYNAADKLEKKQYSEVENDIKNAMLVSLQKDLGTSYFSDPLKRLENMRDNSNVFSTGWKTIDDILYGGFSYGLHLFIGESGAGKSLWLQNLALNWAREKKDIVYFTFELSEELTSFRYDTIISQYKSNEIFKNINDVALKVKMAKKDYGDIIVKYMPTGSSVNDLKAYLKEYEIQRGKKPDAILVDYLDILHPNNKKIDPSNLFIKDKFVSEELRGLSLDEKILLASAAQFNRTSVNDEEYNHAHVAGGKSKIDTCDTALAIHINNHMRENGVYELQFMKTRSSAGVGKRAKFNLDVDTMRISDMDEFEKAKEEQNNDKNIIDEIKNKKENINNSEIKNNKKDLRSMINRVRGED